MSEEPPEIKSLDFSEFHPLDHPLWACKDYPGGRKRHLQYRWEFQWSFAVRRWFCCSWGRHDFTALWTKHKDGKPYTQFILCRYCGKRA